MNGGYTKLPKWVEALRKPDSNLSAFAEKEVKPIYEPYVSLSHWGWSEYSKRKSDALINRSNMHRLDSAAGDNIGDGFLSKESCKKLRKAINFLVYVSQFKILSAAEKQLPFAFTVNLITLTLPSIQQHSDQFIKRECLEAFIAFMKYHHGLYAYVWKAEAQDNGNIHFHITTNVFIHHDVIRQVWNRIIEKYGYIEEYSNRMKAKFANGFEFNINELWVNKKTGKSETAPKSVQLQRMKQGLRSGWRNPNSTDVHAIKKVSNLGGYLAQYMSKKDKLKKNIPQELKDQFATAEKDATKMDFLKEEHPEIFKRAITGQLWNSSLNLKKASLSMKVTATIGDSLRQMAGDIAKLSFSDQFVTVYRFTAGTMTKLTDDLAPLWVRFISDLFPQMVPIDS